MSPPPPMTCVQAALALLDPLAKTHGMSPAVAISVRAARKQVALLVSQGISAPLLERAVAALRQALDVAQTNDRTQDQSQAATCARILGHLVEAQQSLDAGGTSTPAGGVPAAAVTRPPASASTAPAPGEGTAALPADVLASYAEQAKRLVPRPAHEVPDLGPPVPELQTPSAPAAALPPLVIVPQAARPTVPPPPLFPGPGERAPTPVSPPLADLRLPAPAGLPQVPLSPPAATPPRATRRPAAALALPAETWLEATAPLAELLARRSSLVAHTPEMTEDALDAYDERVADRLQTLRWLADDAGWPRPWPTPVEAPPEAHLLAVLTSVTAGDAAPAEAPDPASARARVGEALASCAPEALPGLVQALRLFGADGRTRSWARALADAGHEPRRRAALVPFLLENGAVAAGGLSRLLDELDDEAALEASRWLPWAPSRGEGATWLVRAEASPALLAARLTHAAVAHAVPGAFARARRAAATESDDDARLVYAEALTLGGDHAVLREELDPLLDDDERRTLFPDLFDDEGALASTTAQRLVAGVPWSVNHLLGLLGTDQLPTRAQERLALDLQLRTGLRGPAPLFADAGARVRLEAIVLWRQAFAPVAARFRPGSWAAPSSRLPGGLP